MHLKIDPEFQSLIPPLSPDEFRQLEENILKDGCRDPLVYWNNTIIDGHNRFKICTQYGIKCIDPGATALENQRLLQAITDMLKVTGAGTHDRVPPVRVALDDGDDPGHARLRRDGLNT